jgi:hypothetical protein
MRMKKIKKNQRAARNAYPDQYATDAQETFFW